MQCCISSSWTSVLTSVLLSTAVRVEEVKSRWRGREGRGLLLHRPTSCSKRARSSAVSTGLTRGTSPDTEHRNGGEEDSGREKKRANKSSSG